MAKQEWRGLEFEAFDAANELIEYLKVADVDGVFNHAYIRYYGALSLTQSCVCTRIKSDLDEFTTEGRLPGYVCSLYVDDYKDSHHT